MAKQWFPWRRPVKAVDKDFYIRLYDDTGFPYVGAFCRIDAPNFYRESLSNIRGEAYFPAFPQSIENLTVSVDAGEDFLPFSQNYTVTRTQSWVEARLVKKEVPVIIHPLKDLQVIGKHFVTNQGLTRIQSVTGFTHYEKFVRTGEFDLAFVDFARSIGANTIRNFFNWTRTNFNPLKFPNALDALREYIILCQNKGLLVDICATDLQLMWNTDSERLDVVRLLADTVRPFSSVLYGFVNEPWKNGAPNPEFFLRSINKAGLVWTNGAHPNDQRPYEPLGSYVVCHSERDNQWPRRGAGDTKDWQHELGVPVYQEEPIGAISVLIPGRQRDNNPIRFLEYAASTSLFGGSCFHSESGLDAKVPEGVELECAQAFGKGWSLIPVELMAQGHYSGLHLDADPQYPFLNNVASDGNNVDRIFTKTLGSKGAAVLINPRNGFNLRMKPGFKLNELVDERVALFERV